MAVPRMFGPAAAVVALALVGCGDRGGSTDAGTPSRSSEASAESAELVPAEVVEAVRDEYPHTSITDIEVSYGQALTEVPDATDEDIVRWMVEAIEHNEAVDEWNACLERSPTGDGCVEVSDTIVSQDNPFGW